MNQTLEINPSKEEKEKKNLKKNPNFKSKKLAFWSMGINENAKRFKLYLNRDQTLKPIQTPDIQNQNKHRKTEFEKKKQKRKTFTNAF